MSLRTRFPCTQGLTLGTTLPSSADRSIPSHSMQSPAELEVMPNYTHLTGERCPTSSAASEEMSERTVPPCQTCKEEEAGEVGRKGMQPSSSFPLTGQSPKSPKDSQAMLEDELPSNYFQKRQGYEVPCQEISARAAATPAQNVRQDCTHW